MLAERLRARVEAHGLLKDHEGIEKPELQITINIGLANFAEDSDNGETLIGNADRNLYKAKNDGRNRISSG